MTFCSRSTCGAPSTIKKLFPEAVAVFLDPPSEAVLAERLRGRGTDTPEQIKARLDAAHDELAEKDSFDHAVLNDDISRAVEADRGYTGPPKF